MSERLRGLRRLLAAQRSLADLAGARLAVAARAQAEAAAEHEALERFIAADLPTGAFATLMGRATMRVAERASAAESQRAACAAGKGRTEARLKLAERAFDTARRAESDRTERRRLQELVDAALARPPVRGD